MRAILTILLLAHLAGCAAPATPTSTPGAMTSAPPASNAQPLDLHGTYWMPTTVGTDMGHGNLSFPLNATGLAIKVNLHVGMRQAGVAAPASPAMAQVKLVDASNKTLAQTMIMPPNADATLETTNATIGLAQLVFDTRGGSDGAASGDFIDYTITASPRQA